MEPHVALERPGPSVILDLPDLPETQGFGVVPGLVWAFLVRDDGSAEPLDRDGPIAIEADNGALRLAWIEHDHIGATLSRHPCAAISETRSPSGSMTTTP